MIELRNSVFSGTVNRTINEIKSNVSDYVSTLIMTAESLDAEPSTVGDHEANARAIFGHKHITLNKKNIEYEEEFYLSDFVMSDELLATLRKLKWADVLITLTIYRLGQYSYFNTEVQYMREDHQFSVR